MEKRYKKNFFFACLLAMVIFFIFESNNWFKAGESFIRKNATTPWEKSSYNLGNSFFDFINYRKIAAENSALKYNLAKLSVDYVKFNSLITENNYLRKELGFLHEKKYAYIMVNIIGKQPFNDQILILDKGADDGLAVNQPATVGQGIIVGKVINVEKDRSWLELLTSPDGKLAVSLSQINGTAGLLTGQIGNNLLMEQIPQDREVKEGDLIITSGLEEKIPRGLMVGYVNQVENLTGQIFKQARILPAITYQNLQILTVIKDF